MLKKAFLNGDLQEEFYKAPPLIASHKPREICNLKKPLYGFK